MPLRFLLDENVSGSLWNALQQHNAAATSVIDVLRVGDPPDLPKGTPDPDILIWVEREDRLLLSFDKSTLPTHLADHLQAGGHCPGILIVRKSATIPSLVLFFAKTATSGNPLAFRDTITHVP